MEEQDLVYYCKKGEESAKHQLYNLFVDKMFCLCLRYTAHKQDAEDALFNGFLNIFEKIELFRFMGKGSLEAWIKRIMVNESLMILRKKKKIQFKEDTPYSGNIQEGYEENSAPDSLDKAFIHRLVREMPSGYRTVFNMFVIEGFSHKEIAENLNISENTSKSQLSKAKKMLRNKMCNLDITFRHGKI